MARKREKPRSKEKSTTVWAYCRVSTEEQSLEGQQRQVLLYANQQGWVIERWISLKVSSGKTEKQRLIEELRQAAADGKFTTLIVSELSRLGRGSSLGEIPRMIDHFKEHGVRLICVKENIDTARDDIQTTILISVFSMFATIERQLIRERTKVALAARAAAGVRLGRPPGKSKLDRFEEEIREKVALGVMQKRIARDVGCTEATLGKWLKRKKGEWLALGNGNANGFTQILLNGNGNGHSKN